MNPKIIHNALGEKIPDICLIQRCNTQCHMYLILCLLQEIRVALPGLSTAVARAALPIPVNVCRIFLWYGCQRLGFLTCAQTLVHATAHGGCTDTVRESALEADSTGRKIPCRTGDSNPHQHCAWLFSRTLYQLSYPHT